MSHPQNTDEIYEFYFNKIMEMIYFDTRVEEGLGASYQVTLSDEDEEKLMGYLKELPKEIEAFRKYQETMPELFL